MAGDWIKVRKNLLTDPRVVRISSALDADRLRTVGALVSAWCLLDEHTEDGQLRGYSAAAFDEIVGATGLADAMQSVGWLEVTPEGIAAPRFTEHNGATARRRAQENARKSSARRPQKRRKTSASDADKKRPREEKSKSIQETPLPPCLNTAEFRETWARWRKHRSEIKKPLKPTQEESQLANLAEMGAERAIATISHTIASGWVGLREPESNGKQKPDSDDPAYEPLR